MSGTIGVLNVGAGDTKLTFDKNNPAECIRAARIVKDMIRRGYALLIETKVRGKSVYTRALDFDENAQEYIIADLDPIAAAEADAQEQEHANGQVTEQPDTQEQSVATAAPQVAAKEKRGRKTLRVAAQNANGTAVARTAGG
jgi:hypothetical protein